MMGGGGGGGGGGRREHWLLGVFESLKHFERLGWCIDTKHIKTSTHILESSFVIFFYL